MVEAAKREKAGWARALAEAPPAGSEATVPDAALGALLDDADATDGDAELWVRRLGERVGRLDALNVGGMLAAATEGGGAGARLSARLDAGGAAAAALATRLARLDALARAAPAALHARSGAARADAAARALLQELTEIYAWLDAPPLRDLDSISEISLASPEGRARALAAGAALRSALRAERGMAPARRRLGAVRERLRRLQRAKDALAAALARHLNNLLIHLGNEAASGPAAPTSSMAAAAARAHHADLLPYAPFMRWLKDMDEKSYDALTKVYVGTWSRVYEREARAACDAARAAPAPAHAATADTPLDAVLTVVENICNAEQDFCTQFFFLDVDVKSDGTDGERSETSEEAGARRGGGAEARRMMQELFPALEAELVALVNHLERQPYGAMRALACVSTRVLGDGATATPTGVSGGGGGGGGGEGRWARTALAAVAVAAKRGADRVIADRLAAMPESARQAAKRPKAGLLGFLAEFEELSTVCEAIFGARGRRADLERWYGALGGAMLAAVAAAEHPRTPRPVLRLENYHKLHALLAARRATTLDALRREARARYSEALRQYVTQYFGRPLDKLTQFFEGVAEAVAGGAREEEVCYRAAFSKHELRRLLALYPAPEVRRSLHRLYRTVEKHLSEEGGLLQVVWRAMQEEFLAQHQALQVTYSKHELRRLLALYPAPEVRRSLHRLYRTVEKHLSEEGGLLQVVWRAMQEEFLAQHQALQVTYSKHELRRLLALYPAPEVRRSLHRLYRTVEKHLSEEGGLLQVVWRAMQEEFLAQHQALQVTYSKHELRRLLALYPAPEVRRSLHRLYRTVEKHLSEEGGLLQVVWRAMQEEFLAQHQALQVTYSKHELRRLLALYPAPEVRRSLHRLYRTVEKHLSEEGGLLQVVWRAMQEEFLAQHQALQVTYSKHELRRLLALYPAPEVRRSLHRLYRTVEKHLSEEGGLLQVVWRAMQEEFLAQHQALQVTYSKHELRRLLALYPAPEVRRSLHRLYRTVEKHLSEEGGLLQVVWRAMQEEFLAQHQALQARIAACYPGAGLALPLTTQDILDAFSDIAREH